jgi:hypothetical protein
MTAAARFPGELPGGGTSRVMCLDIGLFSRRFGSVSKPL